MKYSLDPLASIYGSTMANDFGPRKLSAIQVHLVSRDLCRTTINGRIGRIKRFFRWCCKNELVDAELYAKLQAVEGLKIGQFDVREAERVQPVTWDTVKQLIPFLSPTLEAMVTAQFWCGLRPGEVTIMRRCDIDRSESVAPWHRNSAL
jgi:integrase